MDDLIKKQAELNAEVWASLARLDRRITSLRNALHSTGPGTSATVTASVVAEEAVALLQAAARADAFGDAVSRM